MIPWWGWLIIAVVALVAIWGVVALVFFSKVSERVFKTHDDITKSVFGDKDSLNNDFFKHPF